MNKPTKKELYNKISDLKRYIKVQEDTNKKIYEMLGIKTNRKIVKSHEFFETYAIVTKYTLADKVYISKFLVTEEVLDLIKGDTKC